MKRSFVSEDAVGIDTIKKQSKKSNCSNNNTKDLSSIKENVFVETCVKAHTNTLKERNAEAEVSGDLPSLNDSLVPDDQKFKNLEKANKKLQENMENNIDLILHLNNKFKNDEQFNPRSSKEIDTVAVNKLQQTISTKDSVIYGLEKRLEEAYAVQENLKDEKREAISEKEVFKKRYDELRDAAKSSKELINKLENKVEDLHEKLCQRKNDMEQDSYEVSCENDSLKIKIEQLRETIKEKNQLIAQFKKDLNVGQVLQEKKENAEIEKAKAETKLAEEELEKAIVELKELLNEYDEMKAQKDKELDAASTMVKKLKSVIESLEDKIEDIVAENSVIKSEKGMIEKDLEISRSTELQRTVELSEERYAHETSRAHYEAVFNKTKEFIEKANLSAQQESSRAAEATTKLAQLQATYLQSQNLLEKESACRQELEGQLKKIKEKLGDEIVAKEKAFNDLKNSEKRNAEIEAELSGIKEQQNQWQQKCEQIQAELQTEKESAANKYQMLEESNKKIKESKEKVEIEFAKSQKEWNEKTKELQEFVQKFNTFCKK